MDVTERSLLLAESKTQRVSHTKEVLSTCVACLGSLSFGWALGYSSPAIPDLTEAGVLTEEDGSWFGSLVTLGAVVGAVIAWLLVEKTGRKGALMLSNVPFVAGWVTLAATADITGAYTGRILTGIGMGIASVSVPLYIGETSSKEMRGTLGSFGQLFLSIGVFITYTLAIPFDWQQIAMVAAGVATLHTICMFFIPETPRWYLKSGQRAKAIQSLRWLRGPDINIHIECQEIEENVVNQPKSLPLSDIKYPKNYKPLVIGITIHLFQKLVGMNVMQFYTQSIFQSAGYTDNSEIPPVIVGAVGILGCGPAVVLMDKLGRKFLLIFSSICLFISCFVLGLFYYLSEVEGLTDLSWLAVASLVVYTFSISIGWAPIPWLILPELFPLQIRGIGSSIATVSNWLVGFVVTKELPVLMNATSNYVGFWLFAVFCVLSVVFVVVWVPETKGKSLEEIESYFDPPTPSSCE